MALFDENIEMMDKNRVIRIRLGLNDNGSPYFSLNDQVGRERLILSIDDEGNGSLGFRSATGQPKVTLGISTVCGSGMALLDPQSETCLNICIKDGHGQIHLDTKEGVHSWPIPDSCPKK